MFLCDMMTKPIIRFLFQRKQRAMPNETFCSTNSTRLDVIVWQIGGFLLPLFGLPGHFLMILTTLSTTQRQFHPTSLYYIFIGISESIYLIFFFWDWLDAVDLAPDPRQLLNCAYFYPFVGSTAFISLLLVVQINFDRIHMIHNPQVTCTRITRQRILIKILLTYSVSILFFVHYRFSLYYHSQASIIYGQACRVYPRAHFWFYNIWPYLHLFCRLIPCLMIISCTIYVCYNRCRHADEQTIILNNAIHRQQQTFSVVLVCLSIYTFIAVLPITILQLFNHQMWLYEMDYIRSDCHDEQRRTDEWRFFNAIFIMWEASTYMNKFYIRLMFSQEFRRDVKQICLGRFQLKYRPTSTVTSN